MSISINSTMTPPPVAKEFSANQNKQQVAGAKESPVTPDKPQETNNIAKTAETEQYLSATDKTEETQESEKPHEEKQRLENVVTFLNEQIKNSRRSLQFSVDDATGRDVITVSDVETGQEIRKIPSEEVLQMAQHLAEVMAEGGSGEKFTGKGMLLSNSA